ncbi:tRNA 2-selenouridine(34) synthase MnmH [Acidaminobacter sp. JC074]|uniref:tRNA 2-selenouridine(34) synthase MnmH n=1 Tax=Acidaminobacter sp. JC074 TaxID=2530199 RepID=UPI001F0D8AE7|nr:tRNA 2-selenouridine(34) synthase MnmH [Acidaminobacter sp. JC074]MCH4890926.1 tRNA 2-selenouridine(34) synthase MnmH [Acidaminobacter sp. JC074]
MTGLVSNKAIYEDVHQVIVDVRSPKEYEENHIFGAINIPLFTNEERSHIGTTYKQESTTAAKKLGMTYISTRIEKIGHRLIELSEAYDRVIIYCQRGGMRSQSICDLMNALDVEIYRLKGGMKGHRQYVLDHLEHLFDKKSFVTLHGHTGVGKTRILEALKQEGLDIINYEALAQNAGSVFGNILFSKEPPSQKYFEELVFHAIMTAKSDYIFIESESRRVGTVLIPEICMQQLEKGKHILINTSVENRVQNLIDDYGENRDHGDLVTAINKLRKRISNQKADELIDYVSKNQLAPIVDYLLVDYYDPMYQYSINKYDYDHVIEYKNINEATQSILDIYKKGI